MKAILHVQFKGVVEAFEFDSPSDALDVGLNHLLEGSGKPLRVIYNGRELANENDFSILWEEAKLFSEAQNQ